MIWRCLRIFPALIVSVFLTVFVLGPLVTSDASDWPELPLLHNISLVLLLALVCGYTSWHLVEDRALRAGASLSTIANAKFAAAH